MKDPLGFLALLESEQEINLPDNVTWDSDLEHRLLIFVTLVALEVDQSMETGLPLMIRSRPLIQHSKAVIASLSEGGLSSCDSGRSRRLVQNLVEQALGGGV